MNLTSHEYGETFSPLLIVLVVCQERKKSPLIMSEVDEMQKRLISSLQEHMVVLVRH